MNNKRFLLSALALGAAMLTGCPGSSDNPDSGSDAGPSTPDGGHDGGPATPDTGVHPDSGAADTGPVMTDAGVPLTCAGLCAQVAAACTGTGTAANPYGDMATCMTECTATMWTVGTEGDTSGNTLGCRIYHSIVAGGAGMAATHCPHTSLLGGGVCTPFRTDAATEVAVDSSGHHPAGYVRVDRMGMPAVSTALVPAASKNAYNDGGPNDDAALTFASAAVGTLETLHVVLDGQLRSLHFTPCSLNNTTLTGVPIPVPYCAAQTFDGAHPVATLILPDTLRLDPTVTATFPNGRALADPVIDVTLGVLLLSTQHSCDPSITCQQFTDATSCPAAMGCAFSGGSCHQITDCDTITDATVCSATLGCQRNICGTGTTPCNAGSFTNLGGTGLGLSQRPNDGTFLTSFPYFAVPH